MIKKFLIIIPLLGVILLAFYIYNSSLHNSVYLGLPTVPCFDITQTVKQDYSLDITIKIHEKNYPLDKTIGHDYGNCLHAIYVEDASGKVFIKANDLQQYNLGQFFDVWHKSFSSTQLGNCITSQTKPVNVAVNGKTTTEKNVRNILLKPNESISISCDE